MRFRTLTTLLLASACAAALAPRPAQAQFFGQFGPLSGMPSGAKSLGLYLGSGSSEFGPMGEFRFAYGSHSTAGIAASLEHSTFGAQADIRAGLLGTGGDYPLELGGQLAGGMITGNGATALYVQGVPSLSYEWDAGGGQSFSAWSGLGLRVVTSTRRLGSSNGLFRIGGRFQFSPELGLSSNLEDLAGAAQLLVGVDYRFGAGGSTNVPASAR